MPNVKARKYNTGRKIITVATIHHLTKRFTSIHMASSTCVTGGRVIAGATTTAGAGCPMVEDAAFWPAVTVLNKVRGLFPDAAMVLLGVMARSEVPPAAEGLVMDSAVGLLLLLLLLFTTATEKNKNIY